MHAPLPSPPRHAAIEIIAFVALLAAIWAVVIAAYGAQIGLWA